MTYEYSVAGTRYTSSNLSHLKQPNSTEPEDAEAVLQKYPLGTPVAVYHRPGKPAEATLEPGLKTDTLLMTIVGAVAFVAGGIFALIGRRLVRKLREEDKGRGMRPAQEQPAAGGSTIIE